jgi:hypothetical protein
MFGSMSIGTGSLGLHDDCPRSTGCTQLLQAVTVMQSRNPMFKFKLGQCVNVLENDLAILESKPQPSLEYQQVACMLTHS